MDMADVWKNMVLHLVIEPTGKPIDKTVISAKICSGKKLVYGPYIFNLAIIRRQLGFNIIWNMCQLKNHTQYEPGGVVHSKKTNQYFPPSDIWNKNRYDNPNWKIDNFGDD